MYCPKVLLVCVVASVCNTADYTRVGILQSNENIDPGAGGHEWLSKVDGSPTSTDYGEYISCIII